MREPSGPSGGGNPQHTGMLNVPAQPLNHKLTDILYDTFVEQEKAENKPLFGEAVLTVHYQSTLVEGESFLHGAEEWRHVSLLHSAGSLGARSNMRTERMEPAGMERSAVRLERQPSRVRLEFPDRLETRAECH